MTNFEKMCADCRPIFLRYDQDTMIRRFGLRADEDFLYPVFMGEERRLDRRTGEMFDPDGTPTDGSILLSVYDYLCRDAEPRPISGRFCSVGALPGYGVTRPGDSDFYRGYVRAFDGRSELLRAVLAELGGKPFPTGDAAAVFELFPGFPLLFQFWEGDEEFPPSLRFLWDEHTPDYLHFETLFYIMGAFLQKLRNALPKE